MNTKTKAVINCLALIIALLVSFFPVQAIPMQPHQFYGMVTVAGDPAHDGTLIEAMINNVTYASTTTAEGKYGFEPLFKVPADDPDTTTEKEGGETGDTIDFYVAKTYAASHTFEYGNITEFNLTIAAPTAYADFTADVTNGTEPLTVQFMNQSKYFDTITLLSWDFGDENITVTTEPDITHTYVQNGVYNVSLTVNGTKNGENITDTETKLEYITVYDTEPVADFYANQTSGLKPLTVQFSDNSTSYDTITSWMWDFGDGNTSGDQNPTHVYNAIGVFTVNLTVTEPDGNNDTRTRENYITVESAPPTVSITITNPTTENPIYTKLGQTITVNFTYTAENPANITVKIYNSTTTIDETTIVDLANGTDIEGSANLMINSSASDGKYHINATIYTLDGFNSTDTQTEAVINDNTPPTIEDVSQDPPADNVQPTDTVTVDTTVTDLTSGIHNVTLLYSTDNETWTPILLENLTENVYSGTIEAFEYCTTVQYYIEALDKTGNTARSPTTEYYNYHVVPEFPNAIAITLILLATTAAIAITKRKDQKRSFR